MAQSKNIKKEIKNDFIPYTPTMAKMIRHWRGQSSENDKGGSFNIELYLRFCNVVNQSI